MNERPRRVLELPEECGQILQRRGCELSAPIGKPDRHCKREARRLHRRTKTPLLENADGVCDRFLAELQGTTEGVSAARPFREQQTHHERPAFRYAKLVNGRSPLPLWPTTERMLGLKSVANMFYILICPAALWTTGQ